MNNYPLGNFLVQIKNAFLAGQKEMVVSYSKAKEAVAELLAKNGFIKKVEIKKDQEKSFSLLRIDLLEKKKKSFWDLKLYSKPGRRYYVKASQIPYPPTSLGVVVISTSRGIMKGSEARKNNLGGEVIAVIW